tara:strand:- start:1134 stop:1574 length:441 start_codon:yes stop_codon:yes gene_type:complete
MKESDTWESFGTTEEVKTALRSGIPPERLTPLAQEYKDIESEVLKKSERLKELAEQMAHMFPEEEGEFTQEVDTFRVSVTRSMRWSWDKVLLEKEFGEQELPEYITRSLTVDKRKFLKLPIETQNLIKFALTRKLDKPKVKVVDNV